MRKTSSFRVDTTGEQFPTSWTLRRADPASYLIGVVVWQMDNPVLPGQHINFTWGVYDRLHDLGQVTLEIRLNDHFEPFYRNGPMRHSNSDIPGTIVLSTDDPIAQELYHPIGDKTLHFRVTSDQPGKGPYEDELVLQVIPEHNLGAGWAFFGTNRFQSWNDDPGYSVQGNFQNRAVARLHGNVTLREDEFYSVVVNTIRRGTLPVDLTPGTTAGRLSFGPIKQDWTWIQAATFIVLGPSSKIFHYTAELSLEDDYGNPPYQETSAILEVIVEVSDAKFAAGNSASLNALAAVILLAAALALAASFFGAPAAVPYLTASGAVYAAAAGFYALAKDPPEPDPQFQDIVTVTPQALPEAFTNSSELAPLALFFETVNSVIATQTALNSTHGRLLGAQLAKDQKALRLQIDSYRQLNQQLADSAARLVNIVPAQTQDMKLLSDSVEISEQLQKLQKEELPPETTKQLTEMGISADLQKNLLIAAQDPQILKSLKPLETILRDIVKNIGMLALAVQAETPELLAPFEDLLDHRALPESK